MGRVPNGTPTIPDPPTPSGRRAASGRRRAADGRWPCTPRTGGTRHAVAPSSPVVSVVTTGWSGRRCRGSHRQARCLESALTGEVAVVPELLTDVASPLLAYLLLMGLLVADAFVPVIPTQAVMITGGALTVVRRAEPATDHRRRGARRLRRRPGLLPARPQRPGPAAGPARGPGSGPPGRRAGHPGTAPARAADHPALPIRARRPDGGLLLRRPQPLPVPAVPLLRGAGAARLGQLRGPGRPPGGTRSPDRPGGWGWSRARRRPGSGRPAGR